MIVIKNRSVRQTIKIAVPFIAIPALTVIGAKTDSDRSWIYITLAVTVFSLLLFIAGFERRKTGTRRLVVVAVMTALSVIGRFIPFFKPITALAIITGVYVGPESGFLVGALAAVISNFYFGQGPWTPFQMLGFGLIGLFAGLLAKPLKKSRILLLLYGLLAGIAYSFIMDVWTVLWYNNAFDIKLYLAALASAVPYTVMYSISNVLFLWFLGRPFGEKLERIRVKYGI